MKDNTRTTNKKQQNNERQMVNRINRKYIQIELRLSQSLIKKIRVSRT